MCGKVDLTLDEVSNTRFGNLYYPLLKEAIASTQFNEIEAKSIFMVYYKFVLANGPTAKEMTKKQFFRLFLVLFKIYDLEIIERIMLYLAPDSKKEVSPLAWMKLFSVFMSNDLEVRARFTFQIYCKSDEATLDREKITYCVGKMFTGDDEDETHELRADMAELIFRKFDHDKDGIITLEDYLEEVQGHPLLLEFLGKCLPDARSMNVIALCTNIMSYILGNETDMK